MAMSTEFDLIHTYFNWQQDSQQTVIHGVGDDAAVVVATGKQLVVTTDTCISNRHFPEQTPAHAIGYKSLAVNLSDLAAMGATPAWFTLALTLPDYNERWLTDFSRGLKALADETGIALIGGDTTRGKLSITITAMGLADSQHIMLRSAAQDGDVIYVTGTLGDAASGLAIIQNRLTSVDANNAKKCIEKLHYPQPRHQHSQLIRTYANACLDISDGFLADLNHILQASKVGARIDLQRIPLSKTLRSLNSKIAMDFALTGGDDYELLFTVAQQQQTAFEKRAKKENLTCHSVGIIEKALTGIQTFDGRVLNPQGYQHFGNYEAPKNNA